MFADKRAPSPNLQYVKTFLSCERHSRHEFDSAPTINSNGKPVAWNV